MHGTEARYGGTKFMIHLFGVLAWTIGFVTNSECNKIQGLTETSLITNFVQKFIKPYIQSLQFASEPEPYFRTSHESPVEQAIRKVIEGLKPYLQDDEIKDKPSLRDNNETTIIEFLPKPAMPPTEKGPSSELQKNILKYEKVKAQIKKALEREAVEEKTKKMVTKTLDDLIGQVIGNQCTWKNVDHSVAVFRKGKDAKHNITLDEWEGLRSQYLNFIERKNSNKSLELFNDFHKFFSKVINDTQTLSKRYKIKCQLINIDDNTTVHIKESERSGDSCADLKLCSEELREFLLDFYKSINDTSVSVYKNYAAMYARDVISDGDNSNEIDSVPAVVDKLGDDVGRRVTKVFIQEISKLKLDKHKNKDANIKILREIIKITCKRVQKHLKKHLTTDLKALRARLLLTVKQDINMNLDVDLGNLEADIKNRICTVFLTCNGRVSGNRRFFGSGRTGIDSNSVYVKVQLSLDDRLKDAMTRSNKGILRSNTAVGRKHKQKEDYEMDLRRYKNLVTRTTVNSYIGDTQITPNSSINDVLKNSIFEKY